MRTLHVVGISALATLLTVIMIAALLFGGSAAIAQNPDPATAKIVDVSVPDDIASALADPADAASGPQATSEYLHVPGNAFEALYNSDQREYVGFGCIYMTGAAPTYANYVLTLPYGSTISQITMWYWDITAASEANLRLVRYDDGVSTTNLLTMTTPTQDAAVHSLTYTPATPIALNYISYEYVLQWDQEISGSTLQLCSVRLAYTRPGLFGAALPVVRNAAE